MIKKYKIIYQEDNTIKSIYLSSLEKEDESLPKNIIEIKTIGFDLDFFSSINSKISDKEINALLYELNIMIEANILLDKAFDILIKKQKKRVLKEFLIKLKECFVSSKDISNSLNSVNIKPLIKSFFQIIQSSGNSKGNIKTLSKILEENYNIKKQFQKALLYPMILFISFFFCLFGIFEFVVPNFQSILIQSNMEISFATKTLFFLQDIYEEYFFLLILMFFFLNIFFVFLYKNIEPIRDIFSKILAKNLLIISTLYRLKTFYIFFSSMEILLKSKYSFLDSLLKTKVLLNNKYLLAKITKIENLLRSGKSIEFAFSHTKLFDDVILSLISTGEISNSLEKVVCEIRKIYKKRFDDKLKLFSLLIEPIFFIIIMALILWIVFAIFVPLWSMNDMLRI